MKTYKLWIQIEEHDDETDTYTDLTQAGQVFPVAVGKFENLNEAVAQAETLGETYYYRGDSWMCVKSAEL
jgi:hypothetical protein